MTASITLLLAVILAIDKVAPVSRLPLLDIT
jgi:hypothetical protein